jgi:signal transduction histidine kinase
VGTRTAELSSANQQLEAFAYTVSHDLRAPLRGMEGFARILLEDFAEPLGREGQRYADRIVSAAERMERLIDDLLTFSRLQRVEVSLRVLDPRSIIAAAIEEVRAAAPDATIDLVGALLPVVAEPVVLGQVIANLLTNAVKFRKPGLSAKVRVSGETRGRRVRIRVDDEGIGIGPEHQDRIFGAFERLHGQEAYPGTGIGLAIVKAGVERLGGSVGVESAQGRGSRFWIDLAAPDFKQEARPVEAAEGQHRDA